MYEIATKAVITIMFTLFMNKLLSTLRVRQLYVAVDDVLDCHDVNVEGYTCAVTIFNRGKDKEKGIQVTFPETTQCQVISQSATGVTYDSNHITIDRLAPGETVSMMVFIKGHNKLNKKKLPKIKSEDITGRSFWGKTNVWPSLGPLIFSTSIFLGFFSIAVYMTWSAGSPDKAFYNLRYYGLYKQGFSPSAISDNHTIKSTSIFAKDYPFRLVSAELVDKNIKFTLRVTNTEKRPQKVELAVGGIDMEYFKKANTLRLVGDDSPDAMNKLKKLYGVPQSGWNVDTYAVEPGETKTIFWLREITPNFKMSHVGFELTIKGRDAQDEAYYDQYDFTANTSHGILKDLKFVD